jgi:hypothetical protein
MPSHNDRIPEDAARAIWRRAAQLQAEAESRVEERARKIPATTRANPEGDGLQLDAVRSAAEEAGISPEFVQIALAEAAASGRPAPAVAQRDILGSRIFLGAPRRTIEVATTIQGSVGAVSAACLHVFSAHPCQLQAGEVAELPSTSGRVIVFNVPKFDWSATANAPFVEKAAAVGLKQLHVAIRPLVGDPSTCEVVVAGDLYPGMRVGWRWSAATSLGAGAVGGAVGFGVASSAVAGALLALPALLGAGVLGGAMVGAWVVTYRYYLGKVVGSLKETLELLPAALRTAAHQGRHDQRGER